MRSSSIVALLIILLGISIGQAFSTTAILVKDLKSGAVLYEKEPSRPLTPASVTKLITFYLALRDMGPYHRFNLTLLYEPREKRAAILSDAPWLIEEFTGDPLSYLKEVVDLVPRDSKEVFLVLGDYPAWHPKWDESFKLEPFAPLFSKFAFNENSFKLVIDRGDKSFPEVKEVYPPLKVTLENHLYFSEKSDYWMARGEKERDKWLIRAWGPLRIPEKSEETWIWAPVTDPAEFNRDIITYLLRGKGLRAQVKVVEKLPEGEWTTLGTIPSPPLISLLRHQMYWSDNFVAESLMRYMTSRAYRSPDPTSEEKFLKNELRLLKARFHLAGDKSTLSDGCGLARFNKLSPAFLVALLEGMFHSPLFPYVLEALPSDGEGTLSDRFSSLRELGCRIYAKTGTLRDVSALAGYLTWDGSWVAFAIISNDVNPYAAKRYEEKFLIKLCRRMRREGG